MLEKFFFEYDKHTKSTQWDPNVEFDCCDEIVTKKSRKINQEIKKYMK